MALTLDQIRIKVKKHALPELYDFLEALGDGMSGDMVWSVTPSAPTKAPLATAWDRDVLVQLKNADGDVLSWFNDVISSGISVGDTSSAGTASIVTTDLTIVDGAATVVVSGDAAAWLGGTAQVRTITCTAGESTGAGDITMTVTAAAMDNSPVDVVVAISADDDTVTLVGDLVRAALAEDTDVGGFFDVSGTAGEVILTAKTPAADDATLDNTFVDTDTTGVTFGASVDTTPGVAKETDTLTVAQATIMGYTVSAVTSVETIED